MHVLITGGAGYIGSHVVLRLLKRQDIAVTIVDNLSTGFRKTIDKLVDEARKSKAPQYFVESDLSD